MNKKINITGLYIFTIIIAVFFLHVTAAEDIKRLNSNDYKKLCSIYAKVDKKSGALSSKEMMLTESVQKELPELFNKLYIHILRASSKRRYNLIKSFALQQSSIEWDCASARDYYSNNF